jgi:hypothetical protein
VSGTDRCDYLLLQRTEIVVAPMLFQYFAINAQNQSKIVNSGRLAFE